MLTCEAKLSHVVVAVEDYCAITSRYTCQMCSSLKARADGLLVIEHGVLTGLRRTPTDSRARDVA